MWILLSTENRLFKRNNESRMLSNMFQKQRKQTHTQRQTNKQTKDFVLQILSHVTKQHFAASMTVVIFAGSRTTSLLQTNR